MKKTIIKSIALVLAVMTVIGLVACTPAVEQSGNVDFDTFAVKGKVKLTYACTNDTAKASVNAYVDAFCRAYPNAQVEKDLSNSANTDARISSGEIGDVFYFGEYQTYNYAITQNALMPLEQSMEALGIDKGDVYSGIYDAGVVNGHLYYVARDFNQVFLVYNKDAVAQKGLASRVTSEWTWNDFLQICQQLTDDEYYGCKLDLSYDPYFIPFLNAYQGKNKWFSTVSKTVDLTSGDTLKAIEEAIEACQNGYINLSLGNSEAFDGKEAVFNYSVYPNIQSAGNNYDSLEIDWDMINLPLFECATFGAGSSGLGVYKWTKNPNTAAALALFYYTAEGQRAYNGQAGGSVPLLSSLKDEDFWRHPNDDWSEKNWDAAVYESEENAVVGRFECILPPEIASIFKSNLKSSLQQVLNGEKSLQDAFQTLETQINEKWETLA